MITNALNYKCLYYYKLNKDELVFRKGLCFSDLYRVTKMLPGRNINSGTIGIKVFFSKDLNNRMINNYCLLNDLELKHYMQWIKNTTGFNLTKYNRTKIFDDINDDNYKILRVRFKDKYPYEIRLIAALVRNLYEFPSNVMVKSAFIMKNYKEFKNLDFTQRLCIAINSICGYNTGHTVFCYNGTDFYNNKSIKERYEEAKSTENNVQYFMRKINKIEFERIYSDGHYHKNEDEEDEECSIFDSLEEDYISDEYMEILQKNYKIMKENG